MKNTFVKGSAAVWLAVGVTALCPIEERVEASESFHSRQNERAACKDADGDGFGLGCALGDDCNDRNPSIHPVATEVCNFQDDDCNALVDDEAGCAAPPIDPSPVVIGAGEFLMGSDSGAEDESPAHAVSVKAVVIDRHEVTNRRYRACVADGACDPPALLTSHLRKSYFENQRFADYPVIQINWADADAFCRHAGGRLPTEAEWEKAARGDDGMPRTFPWGDAAPTCAHANMGGAEGCVGDTDRVGRRPLGESPYGLLDMAGNVWEWVADWYDSTYYDDSPAEDPTGPEEGSLKVMRGGCWQSGSDSLRVTCRKAALPSSFANNVGFRCAYGEGVSR